MALPPKAAVREAEQHIGETAWYSILHHERWVKTLKYLEKFCPTSTHPKILDVGVWPGYQSLALAKMGYSVVGLDLDPSRLPALPFPIHGFDLNQQDHFPVSDHSCDVIVATEIIEHIPTERLPLLIAAVHLALRPGGYLVITTPNRHHLGTRGASREHGTDSAGHGHTHEYTAAELRTHLGSGWQHLNIGTVDMYGQVGTISVREYYRPLWSWWRHPRRLHNSLKFISSFIQKTVPPIRDTLVVIAQNS